MKKKYNYNTTIQKTTLSTQSQYVKAPRIQDRKENKEEKKYDNEDDDVEDEVKDSRDEDQNKSDTKEVEKNDLVDNGNLGHSAYSDVGDISEIEDAETSEISKHYNMYEDRKEELLVSKDEDNESSNLEYKTLDHECEENTSDITRQPGNANYINCIKETSVTLNMNKLPLKRTRKPPNVCYSDFLWLNI